MPQKYRATGLTSAAGDDILLIFCTNKKQKLNEILKKTACKKILD